MWTSIRDSRYERSHYLYFEEYFFKPLLKLLGHPCDYNLSLEVQRFLRPKEKDPIKKVNRNWGDWYTYSDCTVIRAYGFKGSPHMLARVALDRVVYLEIVRKLAKSNAKHLKGYNLEISQLFLVKDMKRLIGD